MARKKTPPPGHLARFTDVLRSRTGRMLTRAGVAALVFLALGLIMSQARAQAYALKAYRITPETIRIAELPAWADAPFRDALSPAGIARHGGTFSFSVYDPDAEGLIVERLERHPLVRRVKSVRIRFPNEAHVVLALRVPVARLEFKTKQAGRTARARAFLSDDGCLLHPRPYRTYLRELGRPLPKAVGIRTRPPLKRTRRGWRLAVGVPWDDKDDRVAEARAAARLATRIYQEFRGRVVVQEIDVRHFVPNGEHRADHAELRFRALCPPEVRGGDRVLRTIEWGRTNEAGRPVVGEDSASTKLASLRAQLTRSPVPRPIDVRWPTH